MKVRAKQRECRTAPTSCSTTTNTKVLIAWLRVADLSHELQFYLLHGPPVESNVVPNLVGQQTPPQHRAAETIGANRALCNQARAM